MRHPPKKQISVPPAIIFGLLALSACARSNVSADDAARLSLNGRPLSLEGGLLGSGVSVTLTLGATVASPTVGGIKTQADDVTIVNNDAYVSYNVAGNSQVGEIDKIGVAIPLLPVLTSTMPFPTADIHGVWTDGSTVFAAGADLNNGPVVEKFGVILGQLTTPSIGALQPSYATTGVFVKGSNLYAISGDTGGLNIYNASTMAAVGSSSPTTPLLPITDARAITSRSTDTDVFVVAGQPGRILDITPAGTVARTYSLGGAVTPESKSTITSGSTMLLASIGEGGVKIVCKADAGVLASIPAPTGVGSLSNAATVSNAVTSGPGLLFVANGEAGVYVYALQTSGTSVGACAGLAAPTFLGSINFGAAISANNVKYGNGVLFVATGLGGFKIISVTNITVSSPLLDLL